MKTKISQYTESLAADRFKSAVADIKSMFSWDATTNNDSGGVAEFGIKCDETGRVGVRLYNSSNGFQLAPYVSNSSTSYENKPTSGGYTKAVVYAYDKDFFVACASVSSTGTIPNYDTGSTNPNYVVGVARCRNMLSGDEGYCSFSTTSTAMHFFTKDSTDNSAALSQSLNTNASVGAAISLYHPQRLMVAEKIMVLTAIPDTLTACLSDLIFNGVQYKRLGRILIPV